MSLIGLLRGLLPGGGEYLVGYTYDTDKRTPSDLYDPPPERIRELAKMPYAEYLQSDEWRERRRVTITAAGHRCQNCGKHDDLQVHHLTYERRGAEHPDDLRVLCSDCHQNTHFPR